MKLHVCIKSVFRIVLYMLLFIASGETVSQDDQKLVQSSDNVSSVRLSVKGRKIIGPDGKEVSLRGFCWGWWGHTRPVEDAGIISEEMRANCVRIVFPWYDYRDESRMPFDSRDSDSPGKISPAQLEKLDQQIAALSERKIWIVLAVRSRRGAGQGNNHFLNNQSLRNEFMEMWAFLASRYKDTDYVGAFEILSEPRYERFGHRVSHGDVRDFYAEVIAGIRKVDEKIPCIIGPQNFYNAANLLPDYYIRSDRQIIYTFDHFHPHAYTTKNDKRAYPTDVPRSVHLDLLRTPLDFRRRFNVPVYCNQVGCKRLAQGWQMWEADALAALERYGISWTAWNWRQGLGSFGFIEKIPSGKGPYVRIEERIELFKKVIWNTMGYNE